MQSLDITYSALAHLCSTCGHRWRSVYRVVTVEESGCPKPHYFRDGLGEVDPGIGEDCPRCGGCAQVVTPNWQVPEPRAGSPLEARP